MQTIIFVHGFGVKKDARGMFTEIVDFLTKNIPSLKCVLVDLNMVDETNDIRMNPLSVQASILEDVYSKELENDSEITIVCHSQGCVVASIANLPNLKKVILLAPPTNNDIQKTIKAFSERPGTIVDMEGESYIVRKDGSRTIVPKEYWSDREHVDYEQSYRNLAKKHNVTVVVADKDEIVSNKNIQDIFPNTDIFRIDANHNFEDTGREKLLEQIKIIYEK